MAQEFQKLQKPKYRQDEKRGIYDDQTTPAARNSQSSAVSNNASSTLNNIDDVLAGNTAPGSNKELNKSQINSKENGGFYKGAGLAGAGIGAGQAFKSEKDSLGKFDKLGKGY